MANSDSLKIACKTLRKNREKLNITTQEVAIELRLDQKIIDDIENGNFEKFNNYVFLKGYLQNYANFLGVKIDLTDIKKEKKIQEKIGKKNKKSTSNKRIPTKQIKFLISFCFFIFIIFYFLKSNQEFQDEKQSDLSVKQLPRKENINLTNKSDNNETNTSDNLVSKINNGINDKIEILKTDELKSSINKDINSDNLNKSDAINNVLSIDYSGDSWTEIIDSYGNIVFFELVKNGTKLSINIDSPFEILLGNATVVNITYNKNKVNVQYVNPENNVGKVKIKE